MKKLKVLAVAGALLLATGLGSCQDGSSSLSSDVSSEVSSVVSSEVSSEEVIDYVALANQALAQIGTSLSKYATTTGVSGNFALLTSSTVVDSHSNSYEFDIVYTIDAAYANVMAISEDGATCIVTAPNTLDGGADVRGKIHASAKFEGVEKAASDFNILVKAVTKYTIKKIYDLGLTEGTVSINAKVIGIYGGTSYDIFVADGDYGITLYGSTTIPADLAIGDYVSASGTVSPYSGLLELKSSVITKIDAATAGIAEPTTLAYTAENAVALTAVQASRAITLTDALVTSVAGDGTAGANLTIKVKVGTVAYTIFENATYSAPADYATFLQIRAGATVASTIATNDIISISGFTSVYTDPQIVGAKITSWTEGVAPADTPITIGALANSGWTADTSYVTQGFVTGYYSGIGTPRNGLFISDGVNAIDVYGYTSDCSAFTVGTCVTVTGMPSVYSGLIEFTASKIEVTASADITAKAAVVAEVGGITGLSNSDVSRPIHATGILQAAVTGTYGTNNITAKVTVGANETLNVYIHKSQTTADQYNSWTALGAGDEVEFTGWLANYKSSTVAWAADLHSGVQVVSPTIVHSTAAASIVKVAPVMTVAAASAAASGTAIDTIGFYMGSFPTNMYNGVFFGDGENGYVTYKGAAFPIGMKAGTPLHVVGSSSPYNGYPEVDISAGSITVLPAAVVAETVLAPVAKTIGAALGAADLNRQFTVTDAVIKTITQAVVPTGTTKDGKYVLTVTLPDTTTLDVSFFVKKSGLDASVYSALASAVVGGKLSFTAFGGQNVSGGVTSYQLITPQAGMTYTVAA